jgi:hypothetical protein
MLISLDNESIPTIRCSTCLKWHHRPCVSISENKDQCFICQRCKVRLSPSSISRDEDQSFVRGDVQIQPIDLSSFGDIVTAANIVHSIYKALSYSMGASYEYQCLISELLFFEQALRVADHAITVAPPTGRDALDIAAETTTCLELLKTFHGRIASYQKALEGRKGASWRKIGWSLFKADEVAYFRQKISQHKQNITLFLNGLP